MEIMKNRDRIELIERRLAAIEANKHALDVVVERDQRKLEGEKLSKWIDTVAKDTVNSEKMIYEIARVLSILLENDARKTMAAMRISTPDGDPAIAREMADANLFRSYCDASRYKRSDKVRS